MTTYVQHRTTAVSQAVAETRRPAITTAACYVFAGIRIALGLTFFWAFVDKLFGLGFATKTSAAWINGGHPTRGFLKSATGPLAGFYHSIAGAGWADVLFMTGLLGIGVALAFGVGMRIAAAAGAVLYTMMWTVVLPPVTNPVLDDHVVNAALLVGLALIGAGNTLGFGRWWTNTSLVRRFPWLT
jgi:thiosulfate dehydrogenase [quinone] large subunit